MITIIHWRKISFEPQFSSETSNLLRDYGSCRSLCNPCNDLPVNWNICAWRPHTKSNGMKEAVNYQTLSTKDLAKSVLSEGGWSNLLFSGKEAQQHSVDIALLFVGREVRIWTS